MIPSDEKVRAMVHRVVRHLEKDAAVQMLESDTARDVVRGAVRSGVELLHEIEGKARDKVYSLSRRVEPGTRDWDELFAKYVSEEYRRRGL